MHGIGDLYFPENVLLAVMNAALEAACFPAGEMCWCLFLYIAGCEAIDRPLV